MKQKTMINIGIDDEMFDWSFFPNILTLLIGQKKEKSSCFCSEGAQGLHLSSVTLSPEHGRVAVVNFSSYGFPLFQA
jgi:hypothetical protein